MTPQLQERIVQFRKMASDDPDNELGHFRLGQLLMEAEQYEDAIQSFRRTLELSPAFSKVYQILGDCLLRLDRRDDAVKVLQEGVTVAAERGDNMPREAMVKMLGQLGAPVPEVKKPATPPDGPAGGGFRCKRSGCMAGSRARQLPGPPMNDDLGRQIYAAICADCWHEWLRNFSIKVINEMRLDLSMERGQEVYDQVMREFFGFE
jgi:Fe-S cluster biosynthesis and repair protein YggX